jgi:hypothetical protein
MSAQRREVQNSLQLALQSVFLLVPIRSPLTTKTNEWHADKCVIFDSDLRPELVQAPDLFVNQQVSCETASNAYLLWFFQSLIRMAELFKLRTAALNGALAPSPFGA